MALPLWSLVLAAGQGQRLSSITGGVPKQFWRPRGGRSLLDETLARMAPLAPPDRTVITVDQTHRPYLQQALPQSLNGSVLLQPRDRGTAAGILLSLIPVLETGLDSLVAITPSDHGVIDVAQFRDGLRHAAAFVSAQRDRAVVFGVEPAVPHADYGWITAEGDSSDRSLRHVAGFVEKPSPDHAARLLASGALWNTMVLVVHAGTLFEMFARHAPELARIFAEAVCLGTAERERYLDERYRHLRSVDFSRAVLTPAGNLWTYVWPASMGWSDLGTPERLASWYAAQLPAPALRVPEPAAPAAGACAVGPGALTAA